MLSLVFIDKVSDPKRINEANMGPSFDKGYKNNRIYYIYETKKAAKSAMVVLQNNNKSLHAMLDISPDVYKENIGMVGIVVCISGI